MKNLFKLAMCGLALVVAACSQPGPDVDDTPKGITYKSCEDKMEIAGEAQQVTITITSEAAWEATVSQSRIASISSANKGEAGTHDIVLDFTANEGQYSRNLTLSVKVEGVASKITICRFTQLSMNAKGTDANVNKTFTWPFLDKYYLWNEDLRAKGAPVWNQAYDDFLDSALKSINTNMMDGYLRKLADGTEEWVYYSNIQRTTPTAQSMTRADKAFYQGFGASVYALAFDDSGAVYLVVEYVYEDSPAEAAGLKRGDVIGTINGTQITQDNYWAFWRDNFLMEVPVGTNLALTVQTFDFLAWELVSPRSVNLTAATYFENPVIFYDVYTFKSKEDESKKVNVAYMVYNSFDAAYDDKIKEAFDLFAEVSPIDYMILDFRYNGGGNVASCCYLSSLVAGADALNGGQPKVFMYSRYNDERMVEQGRNKSDYTTYKKDEFDADAAMAYNFPLKEIYVVGTYDTASSSEMLINSLRGIGKKVTLVGGRTNGKNVGMEVWNTQNGLGAIDGNHYIFAPITFQSYNCNGESNYDNGFAPEGKLDCQSFYDSLLPVEWGTQLIDIEYEGEVATLLADYFAVALDDILGKEFPAATASVKRLSGREMSFSRPVKRLAAPAKKMDIFRQNAWVLAEE